MIKRIIIFVLIGLLTISLLAGIIWYLAFFAGPQPPETLSLQHVSAPVVVQWSNDGTLQVSAQSESDAWIGLGYGMGRLRSWQLTLWRQAAEGQLSSWFGEDAIPIDKLTRRLGLAEMARQDFENLSAEDQASLLRLTDGLNSALKAPDVARAAPFLLLGIDPEPWQAWHSIAVERLFAWIAKRPFATGDISSTSNADRALRELLEVYGFEFNTITSSSRDSSSFLAARFVTGRIAIPFFVEAAISTPERSFLGLFVPGTFISPIGQSSAVQGDSDRLSWAFLLNGRAETSFSRVRQDEIEFNHTRIELPSKEELVFIPRWKDTLPLIESLREATVGPVTVINWPGLSYASDTGSWLALQRGLKKLPRLIHPDGIVLEGSTVSIEGSPVVQRSLPTSLHFVATSLGEKTPEARFSSLQDDIDVEALLGDTFNPTAAEIVPSYLSFLPDSIVGSLQLQQGIQYLTNWNFEYDASEIGASIFELMRRNRIVADSTLPLNMSLLLEDMAIRYGPDMSAWRWENVQERSLYFPGTTTRVADGGRPEESFLGKYTAIDVGGPGHPQTYVWGTAFKFGRPALSSAWEGALDLENGDLVYRRPYIDHVSFLGSFLSSDRPITLKKMSGQTATNTTTLTPPK